MILYLLACADPAAESATHVDVAAEFTPPAVAADEPLQSLAAPRLLRRMSLDLRGTLPSIADLDAVEADPAALDTLRDQYLSDPAFEDRFMHLLAERWHTRVDEFLMYYFEYRNLSVDPKNEYPFERAVGEEPLRLMARVAADDMPWPTVVTADWTMSNDLLASIWPIEADSDPGWAPAHYTDGRPAAGVLATNGLWWRYYTTFSNYNRGRLAAVARLLLCEDYLSRPVSFASTVPLVDADGIESALRSNPYCMGCHSSIDPASATLFGFWTANEYNGTEGGWYHPDREPLGEYLLGSAPEWYGTPVSGLQELGQQIAHDPRFARCTAQSVAEMYWRRSTTIEDFDRIDALRTGYLDDGERLKPLIRAVTDTAVYRAGSLGPTASSVQLSDEATVRLMDATLLASVLMDLTGFVWQWEGFVMLDNDTYGFRILGGGVDGSQLTRVQRTPNLTWSLVVARASEGAALDSTTVIGTPGTLLADVTRTTTPEEAAFGAQTDALHWRLFGERPTDEWRVAITTLWEDVAAASTPENAWLAVVSGMIRDPAFASY